MTAPDPNRLHRMEYAAQPEIDREFTAVHENFRTARPKRPGMRGPFRVHPPLPENAPRWRKVVRWFWTQVNIIGFGFS